MIKRFGGMQSTDVLKLALTFMIALFVIPAFAAPDNVATTGTATGSTTATETKTFAPNLSSTLSIVLLGEVVSMNAESRLKGPFPPLLDIANSTLDGTVYNFTTQGLTIARTAELITKVKFPPPDVMVLFTGFTDEQEKVDNEAQRVSLQSMIKNLKSQNPEMRIFLVPAATTIGALTSANLRLVAGDSNAVFIPLGTEVSGEPYREALQAINAELATVAPSEVNKSEAFAPSSSVYVRSGQADTPAPEATPSTEYDERKATLQQELDRIAGDSGNARSLPSAADTTITTFTDNADPVPAVGGTITKRGAEAQESINMRPLPAVKAFRPQMPVPRNNIDEKEPALSR